jgi:hypothetical protein
MRNDKPKDMKETFFLGGTIRVGGPDIAERLKKGERILVEDHDQHMEFFLSVENRLKDQLLEVTPWIDLSYAEVEISIDDPDVSSPEAGLIIRFQAGEGRGFDLVINPEQARVIGQFCEAYAKASDAMKILSRKHRIKAPEDRDETAGASASSPAA